MIKRHSKEAEMTKNSKSDRKCFRCGDSDNLIGECPKPPRDKNQKAFVRGYWSDSGEEDNEKAKDETCLMSHASNEICIGIDLEPDEWIKDSGCSKHMTGNRKLLLTYKAYTGDTSTYILNRILIKAILGKAPYELLRGRKPTHDYFKGFGSECFILNTKDYLTKFYLKSYEGVFLELKTISYHKHYDILKQYQNEVNERRAERLARTTNPLALVAQQQQPVYHPQPNPTHYTQSSSTRSQAPTRNRGKAIANSPLHNYESEPEVVTDDETR
ncbi:retrovirus-related pol polyprotein from transposon TNT 1-94 [Tanacetum coccineum]